jgi:hypothetical protein
MDPNHSPLSHYGYGSDDDRARGESAWSGVQEYRKTLGEMEMENRRRLDEGKKRSGHGYESYDACARPPLGALQKEHREAIGTLKLERCHELDEVRDRCHGSRGSQVSDAEPEYGIRRAMPKGDLFDEQTALFLLGGRPSGVKEHFSDSPDYGVSTQGRAPKGRKGKLDPKQRSEAAVIRKIGCCTSCKQWKMKCDSSLLFPTNSFSSPPILPKPQMPSQSRQNAV